MKTIMNNIKELTRLIEYKTQLLGRNQRLISGINSTRLMGMIVGFILTIIIIGLPIIYYKGGF